MTIEDKASRYADNIPFVYETDVVRKIVKEFASLAYIDGAKENGVVWHDLRKDPNDLPSNSYFCLNERGDHIHWNKHYQKWQNKQGIFTDVIAWCEVPRFEDDD